MSSLRSSELKQLLAKLVAFPTVTADPVASHEAMDWVKQQLAGLPLHVHESEAGGHPALVVTTRRTKHPKVLLLAHLDVVPAPAAQFKLTEVDGRWYGRGVFDMKLAVAVYIKLLRDLGDELPNYDIGLMLTTDEEMGGVYGVGQLVRQGWRTDVVVNPDAASDWELEIAAKGSHAYRVTGQGVSGHGSRPWEYDNAITNVADFLADLRGQFPTEPCGDAGHEHDTVTVAMIEGGKASNQVPDHANATLNIRTMPGVETADIDARLADVAERHPNVKVASIYNGEALINDKQGQYLQLAAKIIGARTGHPPQLTLSHGASDSRHFAVLGIPSVMTRPPGGGAHAGDEWVEAKGVVVLYDVIRDFINQAARTH